MAEHTHTRYIYLHITYAMFSFLLCIRQTFCGCFDRVLDGLKQGWFSFQSSGDKRANTLSLRSVLTLRPPAQGCTLRTHAQGRFVLKRRGKTGTYVGSKIPTLPSSVAQWLFRGSGRHVCCVFMTVSL